jgi:DNA topoisomerase-1
MGKRKYEPTLREFYKPFLKEVKEKDKMDKITTLGDVDPKIKCPTCGKGMIIKLGRGGKFMSCETFPLCKGMRDIDGKEIEGPKPLGNDPVSGLPIFVLDGRFGPYVQLGDSSKQTVVSSKDERGKIRKGRKEKLRRASIPKDKDPYQVTTEEALHYLTLPRLLGNHPDTGLPISANIGMFGPYVVHEKDFRSLKEDDVYKIELPRALEILAEPKKFRRGRFAKK